MTARRHAQRTTVSVDQTRTEIDAGSAAITEFLRVQSAFRARSQRAVRPKPNSKCRAHAISVDGCGSPPTRRCRGTNARR